MMGAVRKCASLFAWRIVLRRPVRGWVFDGQVEYRENTVTGARKVDRFGDPLTPADREWIAEGGLPPDFTLTPPNTFKGGWR